MSDSAGPAASPTIGVRTHRPKRRRPDDGVRLDDRTIDLATRLFSTDAGNGDERDNGHNFTESSPPIGFWDSIRADLTRILRELDAEKSVQNDLLTHLRKLEQQQESAQSDSKKWKKTVQHSNLTLHRKVNNLLEATKISAGRIAGAVNNQVQIYELLKFLRGEILAAPPGYDEVPPSAVATPPIDGTSPDSSAESDSGSDTSMEVLAEQQRRVFARARARAGYPEIDSSSESESERSEREDLPSSRRPRS